MLIEPKTAGASVVLIGHFNPAILAPDWFVCQGLIDEKAVIRDDPDLITHPQIGQFKLDWCQIVVEMNKFSISSAKAPLVLIADLTVRTFTEFLPHTPLLQLGINRQVHFRVENLGVRDVIGHRLAPPEAWGDWAVGIKAKSDQRHGGMTSLTMQQQVFEYERTGHISTTVQPSRRIPSGLGIFVQVNDHYDVTKTKASEGTQELMGILKERFDKSLVHADTIIDQVMELSHGHEQ